MKGMHGTGSLEAASRPKQSDIFRRYDAQRSRAAVHAKPEQHPRSLAETPAEPFVLGSPTTGELAALPMSPPAASSESDRRLPQNHFFHKDRDGRFTFANAEFCASLGHSLSEILGKTDLDYFPPRLAQKYRRDDCHVMETGQVFETVEEHQLPTGELRFVQVVKAPRYDGQGAVIGVQGVYWDVTAKQHAEVELKRQNHVLRSIGETLGDGVVVVDERGEMVVANPVAQAMLEVEARAGASWQALVATEMEFPLTRALLGEEVSDYETPIHRPGHSRELWLSINARPIRDERGGVRGAVAVFRDITAKRREARCLNAEHAVTRVLSEADSLSHAAGRLLRAIGESLGWAIGALWTVDARGGVLRCVDVWHGAETYPTFESVTRQCAFVPGIGLPGRVWTDGKPAWVENVTRCANFPRGGIAEQDGLHAAFCFPIRGAGGVLGVMEFFNPQIQPPDAFLLQMVDAIGLQIGQFIERRRAEKALHRREEELHVARTIQQGLLPKNVPQFPGLAIAGAFRPAQETGGDYYDFLTWDDGRLGIVIGDAIDHGIGAAMLMTQTRAYLRAMALTHIDVGQILSLTNRRLAEDIGEDRFVSLFLGRIDPEARSLVYSSAGHPTGFVLDQNGELKSLLKSTGTLLGLSAESSFPVAPPVPLDDGDLVLLFTDGVIEAQAPDEQTFGVDQTLRLVRERRLEPPAAIVDALLNAVHEFGGPQQQDDMTVVVVKAV